MANIEHKRVENQLHTVKLKPLNIAQQKYENTIPTMRFKIYVHPTMPAATGTCSMRYRSLYCALVQYTPTMPLTKTVYCCPIMILQ